VIQFAKPLRSDRSLYMTRQPGISLHGEGNYFVENDAIHYDWGANDKGRRVVFRGAPAAAGETGGVRRK
jgi:hypothetical protein